MRYAASELPADILHPEQLRRYLRDEFIEVEVALLGVELIQLVQLDVAPDKPRDGMIILADGTNFNPGSGAGFYGRSAGAWVKLG